MKPGSERVAWVDYAKGFCIIMVVMMHSVLGVESATETTSWPNTLVAFAKPFRMPDFFMISGLFLSRVIDRDWPDYLDKKVVHFAYFYVLWLIINFIVRGPSIAAERGLQGVGSDFLLAFIDPFGVMWFIYLLPIFFVVVKATRRLPWWLIWCAGAALEIAHVQTGWMVPDEFAQRFVYFFTGYVFSRAVFALAATAFAKPWLAGAGLAVWALVNGTAVGFGVADEPVVSLALGLVGACAVVTAASLLSKTDLAAPIRYCGRNSIVIYLGFFLSMAATRVILLKTAIVTDLGTIGLLVTASGVIFPLILAWVVRGTFLRFLFARPAWAHLQAPLHLSPAE